MIKFERVKTYGAEPAIHGMRNPLDSWDKSDSRWYDVGVLDTKFYDIGDNDRRLANKLINAGPEHAKFMRQMFVWVDITAPRLWWNEFDTYRNGVEKNSCSTMHTIMKYPFSPEMFGMKPDDPEMDIWWEQTIMMLNKLREEYLSEKDPLKKKKIKRRLISRLPQEFMQKRSVCMSYAAIANIIRQRRGHFLHEWQEFIDWTISLPYSWMFDVINLKGE